MPVHDCSSACERISLTEFAWLAPQHPAHLANICSVLFSSSSILSCPLQASPLLLSCCLSTHLVPYSLPLSYCLSSRLVPYSLPLSYCLSPHFASQSLPLSYSPLHSFLLSSIILLKSTFYSSCILISTPLQTRSL